MLIPKRTKYRKQHRPVRSGMSKGGNEINFGDFGIQALAPAYVTNRQIEAARIAMTRYIIDKLPMKCRIIAREGGDI